MSIPRIVIGGIYKVNKNRPCFAELWHGDIIRVINCLDEASTIVVSRMGEEIEWYVGPGDLEEYCINKGR